MKSLEEIEASNTIKVPHPLTVVDNPEGPGSVLIMEYLNMKYITNQAPLGTALANLHLHNRKQEGSSDYVDKFGFEISTCCGFIVQSNGWQSEWVNFFTTKLQEQVEMLNDKELSDQWPRLKEKMGDFFIGISIKPSLLHGDLWSGNASQCGDEPVVFDAASFYGHDEYDLGIAKMFGGFNKDFYSAYHALIPKQHGFDERNRLYQLFHQLNHWNLFGSGYRSSSIRAMKELL
jgi:fructosamine-3-kinase